MCAMYLYDVSKDFEFIWQEYCQHDNKAKLRVYPHNYIKENRLYEFATNGTWFLIFKCSEKIYEKYGEIAAV